LGAEGKRVNLGTGNPPPALSEQVFDAGAVKVNYAEGPDSGPPLVLLHGLGRRWQVFLPLLPALTARWHIYAPDLRGHGRSSHVARGYRGDQYAEDILRFLQGRVGKPAAVFGHSLGGMAAMWVAAQHPELVRALIIGDSVMSTLSFSESMYPELFSGLMHLAAQGGSVEELAQGLALMPVRVPGLDYAVPIGDLPGNDKAYLLWWAECLQALDPDTFAMMLDGSSYAEWNGDQLLARIQCPTLLLQANPELGGLMSDADVERAMALLAHPAVVRFPTLGHALYMQQPEPVLRAITKFLDSL